jgi:hypothetical protein
MPQKRNWQHGHARRAQRRELSEEGDMLSNSTTPSKPVFALHIYI